MKLECLAWGNVHTTFDFDDCLALAKICKFASPDIQDERLARTAKYLAAIFETAAVATMALTNMPSKEKAEFCDALEEYGLEHFVAEEDSRVIREVEALLYKAQEDTAEA